MKKVANNENQIKKVKMQKELTFAEDKVVSEIEVSLAKYAKYVKVSYSEHNDDAYYANKFASDNKIKDVDMIVSILENKGFTIIK